MGEEIGKRSSGMLPDGFCCYFNGFGTILTVGTETSIKNDPEPSSQIPQSPTYPPIQVPPEDAPFCLLPTAGKKMCYKDASGRLLLLFARFGERF